MKSLLLFIILQAASVSEVVASLLAGSFSGAQFSMSAMYDNGEVVYERNSHLKMNPASTMKSVTTGVALYQLGKDYTWETTLAYNGEIDARRGVLKGDLHIIGAGDPMLGSDDKGAIALEAVYAEWMGMLKSAGITSISGDIVGDGTWIEGMREEPSWSYDDIGTYYGTCVSGLNFYENMQTFKVSAVQKSLGEAPTIEPLYPSTPWMSWDYDCTVGAKDSGDKLYLYTTDLCEKGVIKGTYAQGREGVLKCRNNYPERSLAADFKAYLLREGVKVGGDAVGVVRRDDARSAQKLSESLSVIGSSASPSLSTVISHTNKDSNNMYAEMLLRTLGRECGRGSAQNDGKDVLMDVLGGKLGLDMSSKNIAVVDGSGLSRKDLVTSDWMCRYLNAMCSQCTQADVFVASLVKYSSRCYYKTGSFSGCRCLCGYLLPVHEGGRTMTFCIMVNNSDLSVSEIDRLEKTVINALAAL